MIAGPTASGKSALALALAEAVGGTVINADSQQLYRELRLLTARPSAQEEARTPHRLFGVLAGDDVCSAQRWREMAERAIRESLAAGRLPILCGGTGFYLNAMLEGLSPMPEIPAAVREAVRARVEAEGPAAAHARLAAVDPESAARIAPADRQRIARALEVFEASGETLTRWRTAPPAGPPAGMRFAVVMLAPPRAALVERIEARFDAMMAAGALEEVRALRAAGLPEDAPVWKAVGARDLAAAIRGDRSLEAAVADAKTATRQYAKRQATWLRRQIVTDTALTEQFSETLIDHTLSFLRESGLTA